MLVVADGGPLIYLSATGQLERLRALHDRVLIPRVVFEEVVERGAGWPGSTQVARTEWLDISSVDASDSVLRTLLTVLDAGEAAALGVPIRATRTGATERIDRYSMRGSTPASGSRTSWGDRTRSGRRSRRKRGPRQRVGACHRGVTSGPTAPQGPRPGRAVPNLRRSVF